MDFTPVESKMVLGVRYNEKTYELDVVFRSGEKYRYKSVPLFVYEGLMTARSQGQYMHKRILGRYKYERLG
ncbi:MAG TPA: KTSC domain-containing protein [Pyrinomonadaceae bacterium]|nr:KTSC domain-containing protein [Pyrinomonadaceae bacterium]